MPHAVPPRDAQEDLDDELIRQALGFDEGNPTKSFDGFGGNILERDLELGEKADNAVDFGDLSDDDLADDEDPADLPPSSNETTDIGATTQNAQDTFTSDAPDISANANFDDLFGEGDGLSPPAKHDTDTTFPFETSVVEKSKSPEAHSPLASPETQEPDHRPTQETIEQEEEDAEFARQRRLQEELFAMSRGDVLGSDRIPEPPENKEELLASLWPKFQRDAVPKWIELLGPKTAKYVGKEPPKFSKPLFGNKLTLEIAPDDETSFTVSSGTNKRNFDEMERGGLVVMKGENKTDQASDHDTDIDSDFEHEPVAGISWQDMQVICGDWDVYSDDSSIVSPHREYEQDLETGKEWPVGKRQKSIHFVDGDSQRQVLVEENGDSLVIPSLKKQRTQYLQPGVFDAALKATATFHEPEHATEKLSKKLTLDMNDPYLLIDENPSNIAKRDKLGTQDRREIGRDSVKRSINRRYNVSNDDAYDLLKENHQHKVRGTLGSMTIEHSLPAIRLQWPFYKTKLDKQEARLFHRPQLRAIRDGLIKFDHLLSSKKGSRKGKTARQIFDTSASLSLKDNSTALLLEYSEEHPTMLSNLGMGSRIINYYRRRTPEDDTRPKTELGDLAVLLPQDKSPFSIFGHIDAGETTPTLHNQMFRAPIFKQEVKGTDFLVIRSSTGMGGSQWYMRNVDHMRVVGQEFPSVDVPGPHSRKVTTASKNRLKMISYRLIRQTKSQRISVSEVTKHFIDTTDMQNRQKMKEFMQFDKDYKEWRMRPGEAIPDEDAVRTMVKPEDVCLLESMQVGQQHLQDLGFSKEDDNSDDDDTKEGQNIEQQLAPWCTSRNFMHATQGKAMLQLHGEGDPSGRGYAFSFIKTSMKGGFKALGESVAEKIESKRTKEYGGHSYNVAKQQQSYEESIRRIWEAQKHSLSSKVEDSDSDMDDEDMESEAGGGLNTPRSEMRMSSGARRRDDETATQSSHFSNRSQAGKVLRITREVKDPKTRKLETTTEIVRNPRVIRQYLRRRHAKEAERIQLSELKPTGDNDADKRDIQRLEQELARLQRNKERRIAREKQKKIQGGGDDADGEADGGDAGSPAPGGGAASSQGGAARVVGTQRKCANCGQVGHIKTNKKLCPLLNGTMKPEEGFGDSAFSQSGPTF